MIIMMLLVGQSPLLLLVHRNLGSLLVALDCSRFDFERKYEAPQRSPTKPEFLGLDLEEGHAYPPLLGPKIFSSVLLYYVDVCLNVISVYHPFYKNRKNSSTVYQFN